MVKAVERQLHKFYRWEKNKYLTFLTFANFKIGVSVHFLKVVLKKYKTHAMKDSKKQSVIGTNIKTTCKKLR